MLLYVKTLTGSTISVEVDATDTIKCLKDKIGEQFHILPSDQRLLYGRTRIELENSWTISDCLKSEHYQATVSIVVQPPGKGGVLECHLGIDGSNPRCHSANYIPLISENSKLREVVKQRSDAWQVVCEAFNIDDHTKYKIEDNSADSYIKLADTVHYLYHQSHWWDRLTWCDILVKVRGIDLDLAEVIEQSGLLDKHPMTILVPRLLFLCLGIYGPSHKKGKKQSGHETFLRCVIF